MILPTHIGGDTTRRHTDHHEAMPKRFLLLVLDVNYIVARYNYNYNLINIDTYQGTWKTAPRA